MAKPRSVTTGHQANYSDPIRVAKADPVSLTGREDIRDGHPRLRAKADDGGEGSMLTRNPLQP